MSESSLTKRGTPRLLFVDAARGFAMALVCLAHFGIFHLARGGAVHTANVVSRLVQPATPTFMLVSGTVIGMLFSQIGRSEALADQLVNRGLFLLVPGHLLLHLAHWKVIALAPPSAHWLFVTDSIGVSLVAGAWLLPRTKTRTHLLLGLGLFCASWLAYLYWMPSARYALLLKDYLLGEHQSTRSGVIFPILPWFGFYLMATALGQRLGAWRAAGANVTTALARIGLPLIVLGGVFHLAHRFTTQPSLRIALDAGQKYPPGPTYLLFGSGVAVMLLAGCCWLESKGYVAWLLAAAAKVGRASFVVFIVQYFVYYWGFLLLDLPVTVLWPVYFLLSLAVSFAAAVLWERYGSNKYLTVGWPWFRRTAARAGVLPNPALTRGRGSGET